MKELRLLFSEKKIEKQYQKNSTQIAFSGVPSNGSHRETNFKRNVGKKAVFHPAKPPLVKKKTPKTGKSLFLTLKVKFLDGHQTF